MSDLQSFSPKKMLTPRLVHCWTCRSNNAPALSQQRFYQVWSNAFCPSLPPRPSEVLPWRCVISPLGTMLQLRIHVAHAVPPSGWCWTGASCSRGSCSLSSQAHWMPNDSLQLHVEWFRGSLVQQRSPEGFCGLTRGSHRGRVTVAVGGGGGRFARNVDSARVNAVILRILTDLHKMACIILSPVVCSHYHIEEFLFYFKHVICISTNLILQSLVSRKSGFRKKIFSFIFCIL